MWMVHRVTRSCLPSKIILCVEVYVTQLSSKRDCELRISIGGGERAVETTDSALKTQNT